MNVRKIMKFGKVLSVWSVIFIPSIWGALNYFDLLLVDFLWFTLYTWLYIISWYAVVFVMLIRPLADFFPKYKFLRQLCLLRRGFWILSAMIIATLLLDKWIGSPTSFLAFFVPSSWVWGYPLVARLSELTALVLLCTSNNISQKKLGKNWKKIQRSSYIYFLTGWILAMRYGDDYGVRISLLLVGGIFFAVILKKYIQR